MSDFRTYLLGKRVVSRQCLLDLPPDDLRSSEPLYYRLLKQYPELEGPIWTALAEFLQVDLVEPYRTHIDPGLARLVPVHLAHRYSIVPLQQKGKRLEIALADPGQFETLDELAVVLDREGANGNRLWPSGTISGRLARPSHVAEMIKALYGIGADTVEDMIESQDGLAGDNVEPEVIDLSAEERGGEDAAIIRFVNQLLLEAVKLGASDIHLEPYEKDFRVRYRVDSFLRLEPVPTKIKHLEASIISRLKIMAHLDIAEKRLPQDGQIRLTVMGRPIDVRVSILPTMFGQGVSLRLLDQQMTFRQLSSLGMPQDYLQVYQQVLNLSHGVVLVTGPTGSGKTTTLYASINEVDNRHHKIVTVEDPIEYQLDGVTQIQVNPMIDLSFANILRSVLRHDPDMIMVGEIRDRSTAQIAVSAAMTGHLVFSTLHTNDAASAPVRLLEMGVEPYLISSALEAVVAQRLVRILCRHCRKPGGYDETIPPEIRAALSGEVPLESCGCSLCHQTGYQGRTAIFEMFTLNDAIRQTIIQRTNAAQILQQALAMGMRTLKQSGLEKVRQGVTSLSEVYRVSQVENIRMKLTLSEKKT